MLHLPQLIRLPVLRLLTFARMILGLRSNALRIFRLMLVNRLPRRLLLLRVRVPFLQLLRLGCLVLLLPLRMPNLLFLGALTWGGRT